MMTWKWLMLIQASYDYFLPLFPKLYFSCEKPWPRPGQAQAKLSLRALARLIDLQSLSSTKPSPSRGFLAEPGLNNTTHIYERFHQGNYRNRYVIHLFFQISLWCTICKRFCLQVKYLSWSFVCGGDDINKKDMSLLYVASHHFITNNSMASGIPSHNEMPKYVFRMPPNLLGNLLQDTDSTLLPI